MSEKSEESTANLPQRSVGGFWRRLVALVIDSLIVGILGFILGLLFFDYLVRAGAWGRLIGFGIALLYFGLLNSALFGGGQTLGKRLTKIRVVSRSGEPLPLGRSLARFVVLGVPFFLNGAPVPAHLLMSGLGSLVSVAVFGFGLAIVYLYVFNRNSRQSLHDLVVGSYVVHQDSEAPDVKTATWKGHYAVVASILAVAALAPVVMGQLADRASFAELRAVQEAIQAAPEVRYASVQIGRTTTATVGNRPSTITYIASRAVLSDKTDDYEGLARRVARIIFERYPAALSKDIVGVTLSYGYDIGISSSWHNRNFNYPPAHWTSTQ